MPNDNRSRPRRTLTLDPVVEAYLGQPEVNAGRLVDSLVEQNVSKEQLKKLARQEGITTEQTDLVGVGVVEDTEEGDDA